MPFIDNLPFATLALCSIIIFAAGFSHGSLGMGFPLIATPLLALFVDLQSAILITLLPTILVNIASIISGRGWKESIGRFWPLSLYAVLGSGLGTTLIITSDPAPFKLLLAALIFLYIGIRWLGRIRMQWVLTYPAWSMLIFGLCAGMAAGTTNVMVPVLIIYTAEMGLSATAMVQIFNLCFLAGKSTQIVMFASAGMLDSRLLLFTLPLAVVALLALFLGMRVRNRFTPDFYSLMLKIILSVAAVILITQNFWGL